MERVFLNINQTNRELNHKIRQYLKQQTVRGQVRDLRVLARASPCINGCDVVGTGVS